MQRAYWGSARLLALVICGLGIAMIISAIVRGGGPLALGVIVGVAFVLFGGVRAYLAGRR
jgi:hypothetical protein